MIFVSRVVPSGVRPAGAVVVGAGSPAIQVCRGPGRKGVYPRYRAGQGPLPRGSTGGEAPHYPPTGGILRTGGGHYIQAEKLRHASGEVAGPTRPLCQRRGQPGGQGSHPRVEDSVLVDRFIVCHNPSKPPGTSRCASSWWPNSPP